ncbi:hypothetical protein D3C87_1453130 [compost metagenome]
MLLDVPLHLVKQYVAELGDGTHQRHIDRRQCPGGNGRVVGLPRSLVAHLGQIPQTIAEVALLKLRVDRGGAHLGVRGHARLDQCPQFVDPPQHAFDAELFFRRELAAPGQRRRVGRTEQARLLAQFACQQSQRQQAGRIGLIAHDEPHVCRHAGLPLRDDAHHAGDRIPQHLSRQLLARRGDALVNLLARGRQRLAYALDLGALPVALRIQGRGIQREQFVDPGVGPCSGRAQ